MNTVVIIHFQPLELYPPVQNLIRTLERQQRSSTIVVLTTSTNLPLKAFESDAVKILRIGNANHRSAGLVRYWNYIVFYTLCFIHLIRRWPRTILYYETLSSFPAYLYKKFIRRRTSILIHYHEYTEPGAYATGMVLERFFHKLELRLYPLASWISHTNTYRMEKFKQDILPTVIQHAFIMPNYPPGSWFRKPELMPAKPVRVVYAGALSLQTMYVAEFSAWVLSQEGAVQWDIYSYNSSPEISKYIEQINSPLISLKAGVDYSDLPAVLKQYHVGVVLYKGHIPNYVYNAPNKLFEYYACGLDVWFPDVMKGSTPLVTHGVYPSISALDFSNLSRIDLHSLTDHTGFTLNQHDYTCEEVYSLIMPVLLKEA